MIDYLQIKFNEEAGELITGLEQSLLELEEDPYSSEHINSIFRALHTLKGSGAMFGYAMISEFTHHLENLYDKLRNNTFKVSREIMDMTFQSLDLIRRLLYNSENDNLHIKYEIDKVVLFIQRLTGDFHAEPLPVAPPVVPLSAETGKIRKVYIRFIPSADILQNGNNPFYLIDELYSFGDCSVTCHTTGIPGLESLEVHSCYYRWDIELTTAVQFEEIREVFLFVEDKSRILISEEGYLTDAKAAPKEKAEPIPEEPQPEDIAAKATAGPGNSPSGTTGSTIRVSSGKLDQLMNLVSELVTMQARLDLLASSSENTEAVLLAEVMQKLNRQLRDTTFEICMVPMQSIVTRFNRLVRDLSKEMNKEIVFSTQGMETELDKNIIENITDPILHILRNCIDHGIEPPEIRKLAGKPAHGTIRMSAYQSGPHAIIEIEDDGAGINAEKVYQKALQKKLIAPGTLLSEAETIELILKPGFSTAEEVTAISGRGVGLDVVKQQVNALRGALRISSELGKGTRMVMELPMVLSIIDGMLVRVSGETYIIPLDLVRKIMVYEESLLAGSYQSLIPYNDKRIPCISLRNEFRIHSEPPDYEEVIIVDYHGEEVGIAVDTVVGEQQVVIKPLGKLFQAVHLFSGATILGDGSVALVLDVQRMIGEMARIHNNMQN